VTGNSNGQCGGQVNTATEPFTISAPATADCTGGEIQSTTGPGISLTNTSGVSLTRMWIHNTFRSGIDGTGVDDFAFANGLIEKSGLDNSLNAVDSTLASANVSNIGFNDGGVGVKNLEGVVSVTNSTLRNAYYHGFDSQNESGTIDALTVTGNVFAGPTSDTQSKGTGVRLDANGHAGGAAGVTQATISGNSANNFPSGAGFQIQGGNASGSSQAFLGSPGTAQAVAISNNAIGQLTGVGGIGTNGIATTMTGRGRAKFLIQNNGTATTPIQHFKGNGINSSGGNFAQLETTIDNNHIDASDNIFGSSGMPVGTQLGVGETGTVTATITNNRIVGMDGVGIFAGATNSNNTANLTIKNNVVGPPQGGVRPAIRIESGSSNGNATVCLDMSGNVGPAANGGALEGSGGHAGIGLRRQTTNTNVFGVEGMAATATPGVEQYVDAKNTSKPGPPFGDGDGVLLISGTSGFSNCSSAP